MAARSCLFALLPRRPPSPYFLSKRSLSSNTNLSLLSKNYMIPTVRVDPDVHAVAKSLEKKVGLAPLFYQNAPVVLDFEGTEGSITEQSIITLFKEIQRLNLVPVGISYSTDPVVEGIAKQYRIPLINSARHSGRPLKQDDSSSSSPSPSSSILPRTTHTTSPQFSQQKPEKMQIRTFMNAIQEQIHTNTATEIQQHSFKHQFNNHNNISTLGADRRTGASTPSSPSPSSASNVPPSISYSSTSSLSDTPPLVASPFPAPAPVHKNGEEVPTLVIKQSLRSGQQVYARNGAHLVIMGSVHSGAEALADGDIHIYGSLRGRALAGVTGNASARIFSGKFHAELVSIADTYCSCEEHPLGTDPNKPSVVWLEGGNLKFSVVETLTN